MNELRVENLKASCSLQDLDKVFRVFKPKKIEMYLNEQKKSASVIFESVKEAETCFEIVNVVAFRARSVKNILFVVSGGGLKI